VVVINHHKNPYTNTLQHTVPRIKHNCMYEILKWTIGLSHTLGIVKMNNKYTKYFCNKFKNLSLQ